MIPIPLQLIVYDRGPGGTFTRQNPVSLAGRLTSYEDSIEARGGFKSLRVGFECSAAELKEWLDAGLMREMRSFTPRGRLRWEGVLVELKATIGPITIVRSLDDMANSFVVSYGDDAGDHGATSVYSNLTSIAEYGTKQLAHDLATTTAAGAANWAQTELKKAARPQSSRETALSTGTGGRIAVELRAIGRYDLLDWLLTTNTATTVVATNTQAINLLTSYNSTNNWFSTSAANVAATGHSDTVYIDANTSYLEKLETILSQGNSSQNALAWGIYEDGTLYVKEWAGATPTVVTYYRDGRDRTVRDANGNIVEPWDLMPDAMAEDVAILGLADESSAIVTETREYIARVGLRIGSGGIEASMEPDVLGVTSPKALAEAVQHPVGKGVTDRSARSSAIARKIKKDTRTIHPSSDNPITPILKGGGSVDTGGGDITNSGGGDVDVGTGAGIGGGTGVSVPGGGGTIGALTKWTGPSTLGDATAGTDYANASHNHNASDINAGTMATARLGSGTANSTTFLRGDSSWQALSTIPPSTIGAAPDDAKYIVQTASSGLSNEQALGALATGIVKNTTTTGVLSIAVAGTDYAAASHTHDTADVTTGVFNTARLGSGTAGSTRFLRGDSTWQLLSTITPADVGAAPDNAKYIVQTASSGLSAEQALGSLATGILKNTTTTGVLSIAVANTDYAAATHASRHANGGADEIAIDASQVTTGTMATARLGSGTANSTKYLAGDSTWQTLPSGTVGGTGTAGRAMAWASGGANAANSNLDIDGLTSTLTLLTSGAYSVTFTATGTVVLGTGSSNQVAYWSGTNTLSGDAGMTYEPASNRLTIGALNVNTTGAAAGEIWTLNKIVTANWIYTNKGAGWDLGAWQAITITPTGRISISIDGTSYWIAATPA